ncbi:MAG: hypothetical protein MJ077_01005 [Oscillospiraceae bacterium]|nr:hypothetical protein [Oscillospiraceae bacterium]
MNAVKNVLLVLLLVVGLSVLATPTLWILGKLFKVAFDNILLEGIRVGVIACILLGIGYLVKTKQKTQKEI